MKKEEKRRKETKGKEIGEEERKGGGKSFGMEMRREKSQDFTRKGKKKNLVEAS